MPKTSWRTTASVIGIERGRGDALGSDHASYGVVNPKRDLNVDDIEGIESESSSIMKTKKSWPITSLEQVPDSFGEYYCHPRG